MSDILANTDYNWGKINLGDTATKSSSRLNNNLDKNAFLNLLVTQMKYQDPLNPTEDKQFISQMAQFTSLEQMQNMAKTTLQQQGCSLIGKYVESRVYNESKCLYEDVKGTVDSVVMKNGETYLSVGGVDVPIDKITSIVDNSSKIIGNINNNIATSQVLNLVGKNIQAIVTDDDKNAKFIEGNVDYIKFDSNGNAILVIGDEEVFSSEVTSVAGENLLLGKKINIDGKEGQGTISNVVIKDEDAYLVVDGQEYKIDKINFVTDALRLIGKEIKHDKFSGTVDSVVIKDGTAYLKSGDSMISYKEYKGIK